MGLATFLSHQGMAGKALIFVLAGLQRRWKLTVAAYLTSSKKETKTETTTKAESIGFKVAAITSDMGPENLSSWAAYGVVGNRCKLRSSFCNPGRNSEVFVLPDAIHLFKGIKSTQESNTIIKLPADIVASGGLPSDEVNYKHIKDLYESEQNSELKVAFRLTPFNINVNKQFDKMKMGIHRAVFSNRSVAGLEVVAEDMDNASYFTTPWFIELMNTFF
ncbi:hypothetical protein FOCC_FOCC007472 [Frankliniella occidentalis]|nr:hypothetical protein FOCC_FOCC007472 [Frankliniella occidentalis]